MAGFKKCRSLTSEKTKDRPTAKLSLSSIIDELAEGIIFLSITLILIPMGWLLFISYEAVKLAARPFKKRPKATTAERAEVD